MAHCELALHLRRRRRLIELHGSAADCQPADILAGIGPSAGPCCYEVKEDVLARRRSPAATAVPAAKRPMFLTVREREQSRGPACRENVEHPASVRQPERGLYSFRREGPGSDSDRADET